MFKVGFEPEELSQAALPTPPRRASRRPVVLVPGLLGSELWRGSDRLWPNLKLMLAQPHLYDPTDPQTEVRAIVNDVTIVPNVIRLARYSRLSSFLEESLGYERGKDLLEFPYDWRQDCRASARLLAAAIEQWQERIPEAASPITIIAHSLGTLVTRYYVEHFGGSSQVERQILLGGPHFGAPRAFSYLATGADLLPFGLLGDRLKGVLGGFPSMYQLLPTYPCGTDDTGSEINVLADDDWVKPAYRPLLHDARNFRMELADTPPIPSVCIFGYGIDTMTHFRLRRDAERRVRDLRFEGGLAGDDTVPEMNAMLEGAEIHPVRQHHGALFVDKDVRQRIAIELLRDRGARAAQRAGGR